MKILLIALVLLTALTSCQSTPKKLTKNDIVTESTKQVTALNDDYMVIGSLFTQIGPNGDTIFIRGSETDHRLNSPRFESSWLKVTDSNINHMSWFTISAEYEKSVVCSEQWTFGSGIERLKVRVNNESVTFLVACSLENANELTFKLTAEKFYTDNSYKAFISLVQMANYQKGKLIFPEFGFEFKLDMFENAINVTSSIAKLDKQKIKWTADDFIKAVK